MALKQIALTGSSGMLGRHITYVLIKNNYEVLASSRTRTPIKHVNLKWKYLDLSKKLNHIILDKIFGTFHDGSDKATEEVMKRLKGKSYL